MAVAVATGWGLPENVSLDGDRVDAALAHAGVTCGVLLLAATAWLVFELIRAHRRAHARADPPSRFGTPLAAVLLFVVADSGILLRAVRDYDAIVPRRVSSGADSAAAGIPVRALARRWSWEFRHAGADGAFGTGDDVVTRDVLVVPRGELVTVSLSAVDVIHALFLPNLRVKADAIPGRVTSLSLRAARAGEWPGPCAEFCGPGHHLMEARLLVMEPEAFDGWLRHAQVAATWGPPPPPAPWPLEPR